MFVSRIASSIRFHLRGHFLLSIILGLSFSEIFAVTYYWNRNEVLTNDKEFNKAYNWTSAQNGTGTIPASDKDDDFTSDALGSIWTFRDADNDGGTGSYSLTTNADQLTLVGRGADTWLGNNQYVAIHRSDLSGNFDVTVKVLSQTNTDGYAKAGILVANDITNLADGGYAYVAMTPSHGVQFLYDGSGNIGELETANESGNLSYPVWVRLVQNGLVVSGYYRTSTSNSWTQVGSAVAAQTTRLKHTVALASTSHNTGSTSTSVFDDFTGSGVISTSGLDLSLNGSGANSDASATVSANLSISSLDFTNYTGTLDFGGDRGLFSTYYDNMDLTGTSVSRVDTMVSTDWGAATPAAGLGADQWSVVHEGYVTPLYSETYTFYCKSDDGCRLWVNNQLLVDKWVGQSATEWSGAMSGSFTAGQQYKIVAMMYDDGGNAFDQIKWSSSSQTKEAIPSRFLTAGHLTVTGTTGNCVNMPSGTITAANGILEFSAGSGTQNFVPRSGQNMPMILHSGAGTLKLVTNALSTTGFYQSAGTLDFNSLNLSTVASGTNRGDFQVWNGGASTFANISGRTLAVAGNMSVTGSNGSVVNMNGTSNYNLNVTGRLTADYANIAYSTASITGGLSYKGTNGGNNSGWTFNDGTFYWNRNPIISSSVNTQRTYNWTSNADGTGFRPEAGEDMRFHDRTLPSGWSWRDRDNDESVGSYDFSGGQLLMATRGGDVYGSSNEFVTLYRTDLSVNGDYFDVTVKIMAQNNTDGWGKAGLIMADDFSNLASGGYAFMAITPSNNFSFQADAGGAVGEIDGGSGGGALSFPCWIRLVRNGTSVSGYYRTSLSSAWTQSNSTVTPQGITSGVGSQVGLFVCSHNTGATMSVTFDDFEAGGAYINTTDNTYSFNGTGASADANALLAGLLTGKGWDFTGYTGSFDHTGGEMAANTGNIAFVSGMSYTGAGALTFSGTGAQTLTPKSGSTYGALSKSGAGTLTIGTNAFAGAALTLSGGTIDWGTGFSHTLASIATSGSSTLTMGNNTFTINTGNADFSGLATLNTSAGCGLTFTAASGTQILTPKSGSTHPNVTHSGAGTLQLAGSTLICRSFSNSAGILDFNGQDITTNNSGNFSVTNGTSTMLSNLGGRTLTVAGTTSLAGQSGNLLNLNPASSWYVNSTGALTANYGIIANSNASGSVSMGVSTNGTNGGNNVKWNFPTTDFSSWTYSTRIQINTTASGANISSNLSSFPLLVRLDSNNFIFPQAKTDGSDLRFADPDGSQLGYEIERFDYANRKAEIWVNVPQIDGNSADDYITMYWGKSDASAQTSGSNAFPTAGKFAGIWHLNAAYGDATANANNGTNSASTDAAGMIARGREFATGSSQYVEIPYSATLNLSAFTFSAWTKLNVVAATRGIISSRFGGDNTFDAQWNTAGLHSDIGNGTGWITTTADYASPPAPGTWYYVSYTVTTTGWIIYLNGALAASGSYSNTPQFMKSGQTLRIGQTSGSGYFSGVIDEPRVENTVRSADWIKFNYESQKANSQVLSFSNSTLSNWAYNSKVWINTGASGAGVASNLSNFPLLIRLTGANFDFSKAKSDGGDLRFADSSGALLPYELERFDASAKTAEAWVLVPTVYGNSTSQWIRMYWGRPTATSLSSSQAVFSATNRHLGVWHLDEDGGTAADGYVDATNRLSHGTGVNMANTDDAAAVIGNGQTLNGSSKYISIPAGTKELQLAGKSYTLAIWAKRASTGANHFLMGQGATAAIDSALHFGYRSNNYFTIDHYADGLDTRATNTSTEWQFLAATFDANPKTQKLYVDGVLSNSRTATAALAANVVGDFFIGRKKYAGDYFNGMIDEARVMDTSVTADWIKLIYETTKPNAMAVRIGPKPADFTKSIQFNFNTTATGANVTGTDVTNIPILVRLNSANFDFASTRDDGGDIQFVDKDGTFLYHEVVGNWDKANKTATVWVKVPQVDKNSTADYITLYYGCPTCSAQPYAHSDSVWSAYAGVYHLSAPENPAVDATRNNYHGTYTRAQPNIAGITTPLAPVFDGANDYISTATPTNVGTRTMEAWIYPRSSDDVTYIESVIDGDVPGQYGSGFGLDNGYIKLVLDNQFWTTNRTVTLNQWQHVGVRFNATTAVLFYNGSAVDSLSYTQGAITSTTYLIGKSNANALFFDGYLNDVKVMDAYSTYDYLKLSYENQKANSTFLGTPVVATAASFQKSKVFRFNTTASGANVTGDVFDFPALIRVQGTAILDAVQSGAPDIRFLAGDGVTWLPYHIERWDAATTDSAEIWVKVPRIRGNSSADFITMYYQQAAGVTVPDGQCSACVFETGNAYAATWHLNNALTDATANANTGTNTNSTNGEGVVAAGRTFSGADYVNFGNGNSLKNTQMVSVEAWIKTSMSAGTSTISVIRHDGHYTALQYTATTDQIGITRWLPNSTNTTLYSGFNAGFVDNAWHHWTTTFDGQGNTKVYRDGALFHSASGGAGALGNSGATGFHLGASEVPGEYWTGKMDEVRVSGVVRDANYVKLSYMNQRRDANPLFNPSLADFQKSKKYVFNTTRTGANIMDSVQNFPLLVRITDVNGGIVDLAQNNAPDIRFLDGDGKTWLNYQIERWDKAVDSAEVWVMVPQVDGNSDHDFITMYYQQASGVTVADGQCAACVFSTSNGFAGVWHLNEDGNNNVGGYADATSNANHGEGVSMTASSDVGGVSGLAQDLDGTADYIRIPDGTTLDPSVLTLTAWVKPSLSYSHTGQVVDKGGNSGYRYRVTTSQKNLAVLDRGATNTIVTSAPDTVVPGAWNFLSTTASASGLQLFINGVLKSSNATAYGAPSTADSLLIGKYKANTSESMQGVIDEVTVSNVVRSADWMKLAFENQRPTGNLFWNTRSSPNNLATLTATATAVGNIALSWPATVSDSSNADSVGIWLRYASYPDSVRGAGNTKVVILPKADTTYAYPATYPGIYYFGLAVRNASGTWSPFTDASSDTAVMGGAAYYTDTVYVDSAIGSDSYSCGQAQNPATPKLKWTSALTCGANATDTLVVRFMPGTYTDSIFDDYANTRPVVAVSFDNASRAVFNGSTGGRTVFLYGGVGIRNLDIKCSVNGNSGVYLTGGGGENNQFVEGCRIYNDGNLKHDKGIEVSGNSNSRHIAGNLIHVPTTYGIYATMDNSYNFVNNVLVGTGVANTKGIYVNAAAYAADATISNNIFWNWNYGLQSTTANIGSCASNLFFAVTSGSEVTTTTCTGSLVKDPLFANTTLGSPHAFKLLPGSPAIDAGSTTYGSGAEACPIRTLKDLFGTSRPVGSAPDIGMYEGTGYAANPTSEFDSLISSSTATTVTVYNSKWKVVFDKAKGGGIAEFYDQTSPSTNLLASGTILFDNSVTATSTAALSGQSSIAPTLVESTRSRVLVKVRFAHSASLDVIYWYTLYPSGHIFVQAEYQNLSAGSLTMTNVSYTAKVNTAASAYNSNQKNGYGYLTTSTRDVLLSVLTPLDAGSSTADVWTGTSASGASGNVVFSTTDMNNPSRYYRRYHHFMLYIGDTGLDGAEAASLNADAANPSVLTATAGSLIHERSWEAYLTGHWTFDEGAGSTARDKSIVNANNGTITGAKYTSGKIGSSLSFANTDVVSIADNDAAEAAFNRTYMLWVKPNFASMGSDAYIFTKGTSSSDGWNFRRNTSASTIRFRMTGQTAVSPTLTDGAWVHLAAVVENADQVIRLYVNGVLVDVSGSPTTAVANASTVRIGENSGTNDKFVGEIDDVRIYNAPVPISDLQAIVNRGFSSKYGQYRMRADNNNRMVALINGGAAAARVQPAFQVDNWYGPAEPKYVYLNGTRLTPKTDFLSSLVAAGTYEGATAGSHLMMQLNRNLTGADQTLFIDDDDSTGFMGTASAMKSLSIAATANDKIVIKNFADTVFGSATSNQWYMELDLNGWTNWNAAAIRVDSGFGEFNVWKAAAINPNQAISGATNQVGMDDNQGRTLVTMKFDDTGNDMCSSGSGYAGPANITYTVADSSSVRFSLTMSTTSMQSSDGTATLSKRWTVYPTGRVFGSFTMTSPSYNMDNPSVQIDARYNSGVTTPWSGASAVSSGRWGYMGGNPDFHSLAYGILSVKNATSNYSTAGSFMSTYTNGAVNSGGADVNYSRLRMLTSLFTSANAPITTNFVLDISKDYTDSATADSLIRDVQTPALITAITGTRITNDALDFNADNFAEGDGAYTYQASGGIAHFRFVNTVTSYNPAMRISSWTYGTLPEVVIVDNQNLTRGYHYNAYLNTAGNEVVIQFNRSYAPGTHVFFISHKTGLAVTLSSFAAKGGEGVDTLEWTTESEFENLGYHVWRRIAPGSAQVDTGLAAASQTAGAGIANALAQAARSELAKNAAAKLAKASGDTADDTLESMRLAPHELEALGYVRISPKIIPGSPGGSSAVTRNYRYIDRSAAFGVAYEYLLEAVDFHNDKEQFGPRIARPSNPMSTELLPNYPNPFNPVTTLRFSLKEKLKVSLVIYDGKGRVVRTLVRPDRPMSAGKYRLIWDARNEGGFEVPSGQYFYRFTAGRYVKTRKMILVK